MIKTIEGIYQNGQIELIELPQNISDRTQVLVTFVEPGQVDPSKLRQLIDTLETIAGIQQGFEQVNAGQTRPIEDFIQGMQQKYDISERELGVIVTKQSLNLIAQLSSDSAVQQLEEY